MTKFACPDKNLVPLSPNGFQLSISKLPNVTLFSQRVSIPGMSLPAAQVNTPFSVINQAGDILNFEPLVVEFLVDSKMENYTEVFKWLKGLGFPSDNSEYRNFIAESSSLLTENERNFSDGTLIIYDNLLKPIKKINFYDLVPVNLSGIEFISTSTGVNYLTGIATFEYTRYDIV